MDHDLLMMIYGAVIGVGSSLVTTLFQHWLDRREHERRRKEEQKKTLQQIYIPTTSEIIEISKVGDGSTIAAGRGAKATSVVVPLIKLSILVGAILLLICSGLGYLIYWIDNPILYLAGSAGIGFALTYVTIRFLKS